MEELFVGLLKEYGYIILFIWSIMEGEMGLIMAGILCHTGDMWYPFAVIVAALGGFTGDQIYFYIGRFNKHYLSRALNKQKRKLAISHLLLRKYGWPIIFVQRYMYGLRTVLPMAIGLTKYSGRRFALINLASAFVWAAMTITPAWYFGEQILAVVSWAKAHWYFALPFAGTMAFLVLRVFHRIERQLLEKQTARRARSEPAISTSLP